MTNIPSGKWVKHSLYILTSLSGSTQYFLVYGQELFDTELAAQEGVLPSPPSTFTGNMCPISGIIVTDTDSDSPLPGPRFRDIRPTLSFKAEGTTASADHNSLLGLAEGDAHPQYLNLSDIDNRGFKFDNLRDLYTGESPAMFKDQLVLAPFHFYWLSSL